MEAIGFDESDFIPCEVCKTQAVDIHHVIPRSKFGSKRKAIQDQANNLIALCRKHHDEAHGSLSKIWQQLFIKIIEKRKT